MEQLHCKRKKKNEKEKEENPRKKFENILIGKNPTILCIFTNLPLRYSTVFKLKIFRYSGQKFLCLENKCEQYRNKK